MKPNYFLYAVGLTSLLFTSCGMQQKQMAYIGVDEAKRVALGDATLSNSDVEFTAADLSNRSGIDYYQVDFTSAGQKYKYDIDALTGIIIDSNVPEDNSAAAANPNMASSSGRDSPSYSLSSSADVTAAKMDNSNKNNTMITSEKAKEIALAHAGLSSKQVTFTEDELEYEDGHQIYDIEFYSKEDNTEHDYEIDAYTGEIIAFEFETGNKIPPTHGNSKMITEEKAKRLALAQVPGATDNDIYEFKVDTEDGRTEYEGTILYNDMEYEFEIDAYSGAFRSWEAEPAD